MHQYLYPHTKPRNYHFYTCFNNQMSIFERKIRQCYLPSEVVTWWLINAIFAPKIPIFQDTELSKCFNSRWSSVWTSVKYLRILNKFKLYMDFWSVQPPLLSRWPRFKLTYFPFFDSFSYVCPVYWWLEFISLFVRYIN